MDVFVASNLARDTPRTSPDVLTRRRRRFVVIIPSTTTAFRGDRRRARDCFAYRRRRRRRRGVTCARTIAGGIYRALLRPRTSTRSRRAPSGRRSETRATVIVASGSRARARTRIRRRAVACDPRRAARQGRTKEGDISRVIIHHVLVLARR